MTIKLEKGRRYLIQNNRGSVIQCIAVLEVASSGDYVRIKEEDSCTQTWVAVATLRVLDTLEEGVSDDNNSNIITEGRLYADDEDGE